MAVMKLTQRGSKAWYCFKGIELVVALTIIILLIVVQYIHPVVDDFTPVHNEKPTTTRHGIEPVRRCDSTVRPIVRDQRTTPVPSTTTHSPKPRSEMKLSWLLVMYPCCVTIAVVILIEILGQVPKDPLNKPANLILVLLCILLSTTIIAVSLLSALTTFHITMIIISVLSGVLLTFQVVEFILLLFS